MTDKTREEESAETEKKIPTWEVLAVIVGFISTAREVPDLFSIIVRGTGDPASLSFKRWSYICYFDFLFFVSSFALFRLPGFLRSPKKVTPQSIREVDIEEAVAALRRAQWINFVRMFPLSLLREIVFRIYGVKIFDFFRRQKHWGERPDFFNLISRINLGEKTIEYQFPKDFSAIAVRETKPGSDEFSGEKLLSFWSTPNRWLLLTSYRTLFWTIAHWTIGQFPLAARVFPIALTALGMSIHLGALLGFAVGDAPRWLHILMLVVDIVAVVGLSIGALWGYGLALVLYLQQVICQSYWAFEAFRYHLDMKWPQVITAVLCAMSLSVLLARRELFVKK